MKHLTTALFLIILLSACGQTGLATVGTPTAAPAPTETPAVSQVERLLTAYLAGEEIDVSKLSPTEFREFSTQLAEERNAERGANPVVYNNEAYISPENYMMMNYDGHPDMNETIQMYLPIAGKDGMGNLQIINHDGEVVTIENSTDVDWNMIVNDPNDPRIDWPTTKKLDSGFVEAQYRIYNPKNPTNLITAVLLDKKTGNLFLSGEEKWLEVSYHFVIIETDRKNNPILARIILVVGMPYFNLYAEGTALKDIGHTVSEPDYSSFYQNLEINHVYYIGGPTNQDGAYLEMKKCKPQNYSGVIVGNDVYSIFNHQLENYNDIIVLAASVFLKSK